jgi:D-glycero-alpha-D-manno-heptose-7-phosphate kinase
LLITKTPLRVSFFGGGTDYPDYFIQHGGAVLGTAIDRSLYFSVSRFYSEIFDYNLRIAYRKVEVVNSLDEIEHRPFREILRHCGLERDIEVSHSAEIPARTGLGSSSSFTVGLLNSLYAYQGILCGGMDLAYKAIEIEQNVLQESVGCQDQTFAAVGGFNIIEFYNVDNIVVNRLPISRERLRELEDHLMFFYSGVQRSAEIYAQKHVQTIDQNLERLKAMHQMVYDGARILLNTGSLIPFGEMLHQAWVQKRELARGLSNDHVNQIYEDGQSAGAIGGKLLGAGGGGFMMLFVPPEKREAVRKQLSYLTEVEFPINAPGSRIIHY